MLNSDHPPRERDLIEADDCLTNEDLDSLWNWFCTANRDKLDPQVVFTKLVNSARKPYRNSSFVVGGGFPVPSSSVGCRDYAFPRGTSTVTGYTPSECTAMDDGDLEPYIVIQGEDHPTFHSNQPLVKVKGETEDSDKDRLQVQQALIDRLQSQLQETRQEKSKLELELTTLKISYEQLSLHVSPPHVAIKSCASDERYIQMLGDTGRVYVATSIGRTETFELERHQNGMVSFKSTCQPTVWLSADGSGVRPGEKSWDGGGWVGCSRVCGSREKFWLHKSNQGRLGIEPVEDTGRFLRLDPKWFEGIVLQGVKSWWEEFYLVICPV